MRNGPKVPADADDVVNPDPELPLAEEASLQPEEGETQERTLPPRYVVTIIFAL